MEKQKELETLHWEKQSLSRQLESANQSVKEAETGRPESRVVDVDATEVIESPSPIFSSLSRRGPVGSTIASTSKALDGLSLGAGRVLRRSSLLRLLLLFYILMLHFWVLVVLSFSSMPSDKAEVGS